MSSGISRYFGKTGVRVHFPARVALVRRSEPGYTAPLWIGIMATAAVSRAVPIVPTDASRSPFRRLLRTAVSKQGSQ